MVETRKVLMPHYMEDFACIGGACEDTCCIGWKVGIDKETFLKYRKTKGEIGKELDKNVSRNRNINASKNSYAGIIMDSKLKCPFLNDSLLCRIQLSLGENYLSTICSSYPRKYNIVDGVLEKGAVISCPEVARSILFNESLMEFDYVENDYELKTDVEKVINSKDAKSKGSIYEYFWDLRIFCIDTLQNRKYSINKRLEILGLFINEVQKVITNRHISELPNIIARYNRLLESEDLIRIMDTIATKNNFIFFLKDIAENRYKGGLSNTRFRECYEQFCDGLGFNVKITDENQIEENYKKAYEKYYSPYMDSHEYLLENYLVNYIFINLFPFTEEDNFFRSYVRLIFHYSIIKTLLVGISAHFKKLDDDMILKVVQSSAKIMEHDVIFIKLFEDMMEENNLNTLAYMVIMIRS